jgi:DNA-binding response OmpR family regulator
MLSRHPVLVIDDDAALRSELIDQLGSGVEFAPVAASSIEEAITLLADGEIRFEAMLLDIGLPDGDGREFCRKLRQDGLKIPIIMLTGSTAEGDVVRGLDAGANDYIAKPFRLSELLARLRAQLRAFENSEDAIFNIGPYMFRPAARQLLDASRNKRIRLTDKEAAILKFLYRAAGRPVARQVLLNEVWGYNSSVSTHTLETHVYRLRQKIEPEPTISKLLLTEGGGYRLDPAAG